MKGFTFSKNITIQVLVRFSWIFLLGLQAFLWSMESSSNARLVDSAEEKTPTTKFRFGHIDADVDADEDVGRLDLELCLGLTSDVYMVVPTDATDDATDDTDTMEGKSCSSQVTSRWRRRNRSAVYGL